MQALEFLKHLNCIPMSNERPCTMPSNSELKRWLKKKSVLINGKTPNIEDTLSFPITELVFFPKSKRKTTIQ